MATESRPLISQHLLLKVEETARAQNRAPAELVEEAVGKYLAGQRLTAFAEKMEKRLRAKGIREKDLPRLVNEVRRENAARGR